MILFQKRCERQVERSINIDRNCRRFSHGSLAACCENLTTLDKTNTSVYCQTPIVSIVSIYNQFHLSTIVASVFEKRQNIIWNITWISRLSDHEIPWGEAKSTKWNFLTQIQIPNVYFIFNLKFINFPSNCH